MVTTKTKITLGTILLILLATGVVYVVLQGAGVKMRVDNDKTTFYILNENNRWVISGREINSLWDGTKKMKRRLSNTYVDTVYDNISKITTITRHTQYIRGPRIIDTYIFDGKLSDKEHFPVSHTIELFDAQGFIYQYEARELDYHGPDLNLLGQNSISVGLNMKITWAEDPYLAKLDYLKSYDYAKLILRYKINGDYAKYNIRLFDPSDTIIQDNVTGNLGDNTVYSGEPDTVQNHTHTAIGAVRITDPSTLIFRSYIKFNKTAIPNGTTFIGATLNLYESDNTDTGIPVCLYHVTTDVWAEDTITWNNQPCGTAFDNASACNLTPLFNTSSDGSDRWHVFDIYPVVKNTYNITKNISFAIKFCNETGGGTGQSIEFRTRDYTIEAQRPYLNITYNNPPTSVEAKFDPDVIFDTENASGWCNGTDADLETVKYYWNITKNNNVVESGSTSKDNNQGVFINVVNYTNITLGDEIILSCMVSDEIANGTWVDSIPLTITDNNQIITLNTPVDGSHISDSWVLLNVTVKDKEGNSMNVSFYNSNGDLLNTNTSITSGSYAIYNWTGLSSNEYHSFYVNASDGINSTLSSTWGFGTGTVFVYLDNIGGNRTYEYDTTISYIAILPSNTENMTVVSSGLGIAQPYANLSDDNSSIKLNITVSGYYDDTINLTSNTEINVSTNDSLHWNYSDWYNVTGLRFNITPLYCWKYYEDAVETTIEGTSYLSVNYTKPDDYINLTWQVKHGELATYNVTIPSDCENADNEKLMLRIRSYYVTAGGFGESYPQCYNGTDWITIGTVTNTSSETGCPATGNNSWRTYDGDWNTYSKKYGGGGWTTQCAGNHYSAIYEEGMYFYERCNPENVKIFFNGNPNKLLLGTTFGVDKLKTTTFSGKTNTTDVFITLPSSSEYVYINISTQDFINMSFNMTGFEADPVGLDYYYPFINTSVINSSSVIGDYPVFFIDDLETNTGLYSVGGDLDTNTYNQDKNARDIYSNVNLQWNGGTGCGLLEQESESGWLSNQINLEEHNIIGINSYVYAKCSCNEYNNWKRSASSSSDSRLVISTDYVDGEPNYEIDNVHCSCLNGDCYGWKRGDTTWGSCSPNWNTTYWLTRNGEDSTTWNVSYGDNYPGTYYKQITLPDTTIYVGYRGSLSAQLSRDETDVSCEGYASSTVRGEIYDILLGGVGGDNLGNNVYNTTFSVNSTRIFNTSENITGAIMSVTTYTPLSSSQYDINYYLSPNNGSDWEEVENGVYHVFQNKGTDLKWKVNGTELINTSNFGITKVLVDVITSSAENVTLDLADDTVIDYNMTGIYNYTSTISLTNTTGVNNYIGNNCYDEDSCIIPIAITSDSIGGLSFSNLKVLSRLNPVVLNPDNFTTTGNITILDDENFNITINDWRLYFIGDKDYITITTTFENGSTITDNKHINVTYSPYTLSSITPYLEFYPTSLTVANITPRGQTSGIPYWNVTAISTHHTTDFYIRLNNSLPSCATLTASNSTKNISLTDSGQKILSLDGGDSGGIWHYLTMNNCNEGFYLDIIINSLCSGCVLTTDYDEWGGGYN